MKNEIITWIGRFVGFLDYGFDFIYDCERFCFNIGFLISCGKGYCVEHFFLQDGIGIHNAFGVDSLDLAIVYDMVGHNIVLTTCNNDIISIRLAEDDTDDVVFNPDDYII